jgi:serine-type D-Ala-D-Ala endopeptidase (penicillin-binding protein 7)
MTKFFITLLLLPLSVFANTNSVVYNITNNQVVSGSLNDSEVSIASISKLMTIYTVLRQEQDLNERLIVDNTKTPTTRLSKGMTLTRLELINLALISSDNKAAITLSQNFPGGQPYFVYSMNEHTRHLGMIHSGFVEPTGLSPMNYSSIDDLIKLTQAVSQYDLVQEAAKSTKSVALPTKTKKGKKIVKVSGRPTSQYFGKDGIITIKTGFTRAAGFCITMLVQANNQLYNITVLGAKSKQERERIVKKSLDKIYST